MLNEPTENARGKLASKSGVKGVSLLAQLPSIRIPISFPAEVMHMVWINLIPQLADLWLGKFNQLDDGKESYQIDIKLWNSIGDVCEASGATIPASFGCRVPHLNKRSHFIAESWSLWATQLAPYLLRPRGEDPFFKPRYYIHFIQLVKLMKECMDYSMKRANLPRIRQGFANWVKDYEK